MIAASTATQVAMSATWVSPAARAMWRWVMCDSSCPMTPASSLSFSAATMVPALMLT